LGHRPPSSRPSQPTDLYYFNPAAPPVRTRSTCHHISFSPLSATIPTAAVHSDSGDGALNYQWELSDLVAGLPSLPPSCSYLAAKSPSPVDRPSATAVLPFFYAGGGGRAQGARVRRRPLSSNRLQPRLTTLSTTGGGRNPKT
jgi:hypothetical protein